MKINIYLTLDFDKMKANEILNVVKNIQNYLLSSFNSF